MSCRIRLVILIALALPTMALGGPIHWSYRAVDVASGATLSERFGLTEPNFALGSLLPRPVEPIFAPTVADRTLGYYEPKSTSSAVVTILDEASGERGDGLIAWTLGELWEFKPSAEAWEPISKWERGEPFQDAKWLKIGSSEYRVRTDGGPLYVDVRRTVVTPEPATLAIVGLGLLTVGLARWRKSRTDR